jgi:hypothetical protein
MLDKGGIFSSASVYFIIETEPMNWSVKRKYEDVLWLREQLQRFFPATLVYFINKFYFSFPL